MARRPEVNLQAFCRVDTSMARSRFKLSAHAAHVLAERGIDLAWVERTLMRPDRVEPDRLDQALTHALARIDERERRVLRVIYNASMDPLLVVTAYFDRGQRDKP